MATMQQAIDALNAAATAYNTGAAQIQQAIQQAQTDVQNYITNARAEYGGYNLLPNHDFLLDTNGDGLPDGYFVAEYGTGASTFALVAPDAAAPAGSDAKLVSDMLAAHGFSTNYAPFVQVRALKIATPPGASTWVGTTYAGATPVVGISSAGCILHIKTNGNPVVKVTHRQTSAGEVQINTFNQTLLSAGYGNGVGSTQHMLVQIDNTQQASPCTTFLLLPWLCKGIVQTPILQR